MKRRPKRRSTERLYKERLTRLPKPSREDMINAVIGLVTGLNILDLMDNAFDEIDNIVDEIIFGLPEKELKKEEVFTDEN